MDVEGERENEKKKIQEWICILYEMRFRWIPFFHYLLQPLFIFISFGFKIWFI